MRTFKGFDKDLKCRGFQYEIGGEYKESEAVLCESGFHAYENPLDVFKYYPPNNSRYCVVELDDISNERDEDSKICGKRIKIIKEIDIKDLIDAGVNFILNYAKEPNTGKGSAATNTRSYSIATNTRSYSIATNTWAKSIATNAGTWSAATNTGDSSVATNTGDSSVATNTGYGSVANNTGDHSVAINTGNGSAATNSGANSVATNTGDYGAAINIGRFSSSKVTGGASVAIGTGYKSEVSAPTGSVIGLVERNSTGKIISAKMVIVDGEIIKADTYYRLEKGKLVEACEEESQSPEED